MGKTYKDRKAEKAKNVSESTVRNRKTIRQSQEADDEYKGWVEQVSEELLDSDD